ncbi:MAG: Transcription elongation factor GreA [candidate division WWE3 bacterium GW2011_GWA1_41_8]|uniref:Transcription elongation factor GreA n=2 Tax=Katanobacteria TaxID=422282 RepID=A0A0G0XC07_UNCKA|nr:MAG: Transcription elongation factor GreA [candidate division WWE3 bacterium GW2011_GWB1_41_6]KKS22420.1 MAG: Transcription elongation factor GreA [candidate division WWE3 bacterium GW2011_GWA1_41_8]
MSDTIIVTKEGLETLKNELKELTEVKRPQVANRIKSAREMGDISENAEYDAARQEQSFVEGRINELEEILKKAKPSDTKSNGEIIVGSKVTLRIDGEEEEYHVVGAPEANPKLKKISHESPLGSSLLGKKVGDKIVVEAPVGELTYTILHIK